MLHSIRSRGAPLPEASNEPIDLLAACHVRLRSFSALSLALANRGDLPRAEIDDASERLLRYFRIALPLHEADEERTLAPAIAALATREEADAVASMCAEHRAIDDVLAELFPRWESRATSALAPHARRLEEVLGAHLPLEEKTIFPILTRVAESDRARLAAEMRARREIKR